MSHNPFAVVKDFERVVGEYTGAPYVVSTNSCTSALLLAVAWHFAEMQRKVDDEDRRNGSRISRIALRPPIEIPRRTYISVAASIINAGGRPAFRDEDWKGMYQLKPLPVYDSARLFTSGMYRPGTMMATSHHWSKTLGIQQGGCILLDDPEADAWLRRMRFDGRTEGVPPKDDNIREVGQHCYLAPEVAALGLVRMAHIPRHNEPLPNDDYPDLSLIPVFQ